MTALIRTLLLPLLLLATVPVSAQSLTVETLDRVIAVVDEDVILASELDRSVNNIIDQYADRAAQLPPRDVLERQVLERMILMKVQADRAQETGIRISEMQVDAAIGDVARSNGLTPDQLRASLEQQGLHYGEFRETVREELLIQALQQRFVQTRVSVSESEIDNLLGSGQLQRGEVHIGHILIAVPEGADSHSIEEARSRAQAVHDQIQAGMDFASAAIRHSNAPNALDGGDLGWRGLNEIPSVFIDIVAQMREGEVTPAIRSPGGFHLLKLYGRRADSQRLVEEFNARHIMIEFTELTSPEQAERRIRDVHRQILDGADFTDMAREHSDDHNTGPLGGDLGWFPPEAYGTGVAQVLPTLADGEISEPFRSDVGWHLLQRLGNRQQDRTADFLRRQAAETIRSRKAGEEFERYVRELRGEAYIENRLDDDVDG
ncbi:MAG: peptidylprolyl isomerase [Xanthomonadales bacterium]|nr:peptidylprolyl isomerase [Xanthomonadales bacterium]